MTFALERNLTKATKTRVYNKLKKEATDEVVGRMENGEICLKGTIKNLVFDKIVAYAEANGLTWGDEKDIRDKWFLEYCTKH